MLKSHDPVEVDSIHTGIFYAVVRTFKYELKLNFCAQHGVLLD